MTTVTKIGLRLFLEGLECPVEAVNISIQTNSPSTASISIPPHDLAFDIAPGTEVQLFTLDPGIQMMNAGWEDLFREYQKDLDSYRKAEPSESHGPYNSKLPLTPEWVLLFAGEVRGVSYQKTDRSRTIQLSCYDYSNILDVARIGILSSGTDTNFVEKAVVFAGNNASQVSAFPSLGSGAYLQKALSQKPVSFPDNVDVAGGILGGILSLFEDFFGVTGTYKSTGSIRPTSQKFAGINQWVTFYNIMNRVVNQIGVAPGDTTALNLYKDKELDQFLQRIVEQAGTLITFRDFLKLVFRTIYYETVSNPTAMYVPASPREKGVAQYNDRLLSILFRPDLFFAPPPKCNVLFPDMYNSLSFGHDFNAEITRTQVDFDEVMLGRGSKVQWNMVCAPALGYDPDDVPFKFEGLEDAWDMHRVVMPHEKFYGINPSFARAPMLFARQALVKSGDKKGDFKLLYAYGQSFAEYTYYRQKYASRTMTVSGVFNPYVVCGFPALVIDGVIPEDLLDEDYNLGDPHNKISQAQYPTQWLGNVVSINHSIHSQTGGTTTITMSHARQHKDKSWREFGVEFDYNSPMEIKVPTDIVKEGDTYVPKETVRVVYGPEDLMFPAFYDDIYSTKKVGRSVYLKLFGSLSIVDVGFTSLEGLDALSVGLMVKRNPAGSGLTYPNILAAVDSLTLAYSLERSGKGSIFSAPGTLEGSSAAFAMLHIWRPIANAQQVIGQKSDKEWEQYGFFLPAVYSRSKDAARGRIYRFGYDTIPNEPIPEGRGRDKSIDIRYEATYDPRKERFEIVERYINAIVGGDVTLKDGTQVTYAPGISHG